MPVVDEILLATKSRFKSGLLASAKVPFDCYEPEVIEKNIEASNARKTALARAKAKAEVAAIQNPLSLTIGSDQTLELDGGIYGKVEDREQARERITLLSGKTHFLHTSYALCWTERASDAPITFVEKVVSAKLSMRKMSESEIDAYLRGSYEWQAVTGCYRYESRGVHLFDKVEGEYSTIVGLPLVDLLSDMRSIGINFVMNPIGPWEISVP